MGDIWTWVALEEDSRMVVSYTLGGRDLESARIFMQDLSRRVNGELSITTDALPAYPTAIDTVFGKYAHHNVKDGKTKSTSYVERQNLSLRMGMGRYTRKTNGFSKKLENLFHMLSIFYLHYNYIRGHSTMGMAPAMALGVAREPLTLEWLAEQANELIPEPIRPKTYKRRKISN